MIVQIFPEQFTCDINFYSAKLNITNSSERTPSISEFKVKRMFTRNNGGLSGGVIASLVIFLFDIVAIFASAFVILNKKGTLLLWIWQWEISSIFNHSITFIS